MRFRPTALLLVLALALAASPALAGSPEAPELTDAKGDCDLAYGNEYLDIVSAWVAGETETTFDVHLALAKWTEPLAEGSGLTVLFSHQGVEWGVVAAYSKVIFEDGWIFWTGRVADDKTQGFEETTGSFTPGSPAVLAITFPKNRFPHTDANDNALRGFNAFSADLRPAYPFIGAEAYLPVSSDGRWVVCDEAEGSGVYEFSSGRHSRHAHSGSADGESASATAPPADAGGASASAEVEAAPTADGSEQRAVPSAAAAGVVLALAVAANVALARRRRSPARSKVARFSGVPRARR